MQQLEVKFVAAVGNVRRKCQSRTASAVPVSSVHAHCGAMRFD